MNRIAAFEKVSPGQFSRDWQNIFGQEPEAPVLESLSLPRRATKGSAGYDFYLPCDITLRPGEGCLIPTGVRCHMDEGWVLQLYPRSGLGFKYRLQMDNTVGIIDSDYYGSDNEGHIMARLTNDSRSGRTLELKAGTAFMQGVFVSFGITIDDDAAAERNGGFGSTGI
jgi:dUTP pyrophosphatase